MKKAPQKLVTELLSRAESVGIATESALCKKVGIDQAYFSRWKNREYEAPDPRKTNHLRFYINAAKFLRCSFGEVMAMVLLGVKNAEVAEDVKRRLDEHTWDQEIVDLDEVNRKCYLLGYNSAGREEVLDLAIDVARSYIERVRKEEWRDLE